jgi:hypothetical protein
MLAAAVLTITAAGQARDTDPAGQILLTRNEIAHLIDAPSHRHPSAAHALRWSRWRRRHQHRARTCHYQQQAARDQGT